MRILLLNGNPDPGNTAWERSLDAWARTQVREGNAVSRKDLRDLRIRFCTGCWSCWYTTPGLCAIRDDMASLYPEMLGSDLTVWASPLVLGNVSALVKKTQDRFIPLLHPFFELDRGEMHHRRRYPKDIDMGLIVGKGPTDTNEDLEIVRTLHERLARNGRGRLVLCQTIEYATEEMDHEKIDA